MIAPSNRPIDYSETLPWTRLLRSFRIATDPRKLILAALAITVYWGGERLLGLLPFAPADVRSTPAPWDEIGPALLTGGSEPSSSVFETPAPQASLLAERVVAPVEPLIDVLGLAFGSRLPWSEIGWLWTRLLWTLAVWSLFGGAIARLAAVEFARDERIGLSEAFRFSLWRFPSLFAAPLLPIGAILLLWAINSLGGLIGRIPFAGEAIVAVAWGVAAVFAFLILLVAIATAVGWPLMVAAIGTENSDSFDGFSRSFSFLYGRPWLSVWYLAVALLIGIACVAVVDTLAVGIASAAARTVATGMGEQSVSRLYAAAPGYFADIGPTAPASEPVRFPAIVASVWLTIIAAVAVGFATSYFWTASTIVYFLLRRADDATQFDEVWLGESDEEDDLLPLAGIASTDQPVTERPHHPTVDPPVGAS